MSLLSWIFKGSAPNDKTGTPAILAADIINNNFAYLEDRIINIENPDGVLKSGNIDTDGLNVDVAAGAFEWQIDQLKFLDNPVFHAVLDAATDGYYRKDVLLGNNTGGYNIFKGEEDPTSATEPNLFPVGTIKLGVIDVYGSVITGSIPVDVSGKEDKANKNQPHGYAGLDGAGKIYNSQLPALNSDNVIEGAINKYSTRSLVMSYILTGISFATGTPITASDTILSAFGKLQKQISDMASDVMTISTDQNVSGIKTFLAGKFAMRNVANTFSSFFTNTNTASRTYILQDRNGTLLDSTDLTNINNSIAAKQSLFSGVANYLPKSSNATTLIPSRIQDTGAYIGIDTVNTPDKDITLNNRGNKTIGVELSSKNATGKDLFLKAGSTINYNLSGLFTNVNNTLSCNSVAVHPVNRNVYACTSNALYVNLGGTGTYELFPISDLGFRSVYVLGNDVYIASALGKIYKQTGGSGSFTVVSGITSRVWESMSVTPNGDVLAAVENVGLFLQTAGVGDFVSIESTNRRWFGVCQLANGDRYACVAGGDIYKQTGGVGAFIGTGQSGRDWRDMAVDSSSGIYVCVNNGDIYYKANGSSTFVAQGNPVNTWNGIYVDINGDIYAGALTGGALSQGVFIKYASDEGTANLDGGTFIIESGTGKGTGKSRIEFYTGQKLSSGTTMQVKTLRAYYDENGYFVNLGIPSYANDAAADADANLPSKAFYKISGNRGVFQKP